MGGGFGVEPLDEADEIGLGHGGAAGGGGGGPAADVEEDGAAVARGGRLLVMPDLEHPFVGGVAQAHFLFFEPRRDVAGVDTYVGVVMGIGGVVDVGIPRSDLLIRPAGAGRRRRSITKKTTELEEAGGGAAIFFDLHGDAIGGHVKDAAAPGETTAPEKDGDGLGEDGLPRIAGGSALIGLKGGGV